MAVLEKIRVKFGILITVLIAIALLSFIIDPDTLRTAAQKFSPDNEVGKMNGKTVDYKTFYEEVEHYTKLSEITGQPVNGEEGQAAMREAAWQSIFDEEVFLPLAEKAGITVGGQEMYDLTQGSSISPILYQQGVFAGPDGYFSRERLAEFVQQTSSDANSALYWDFLETTIYRQQVYAKYYSILKNATVTNAVERQRAIQEANASATVDFVLVPPRVGADSTTTVSSSEIRSYYNARKSLMKQPESRDIEYVMFEVVPSTDDINAVKEEFDAIYEGFKTTDNLKNYVALNNGRFDTYYYNREQLSSVPEFEAVAFGDAGEISEIHIDAGKSFSAARVNDVKMMADSAHVFYAVVPLAEEAKADSLFNEASKGNTDTFTEMGWLTQELIASNGLTDFEKTLYTGEKALKIKNVNAQAWFVVYVDEQTSKSKKVQLATLVKQILPSDETYRDFMMKATDLIDRADGKYVNFEIAVKEDQLPVVPYPGLLESTRTIGQVENAREVVRWAFDKKSKAGTVADEVIVVDNKYYFVPAVKAVHKEGVAPLKDVAEDIRMVLLSEKKVSKLKDEVAGKIEGCSTLEQISEKMQVPMNHKDGVTFGGAVSQQIDPKFLGAVAAAEPGQLVGPVEGLLGVYIFNVADRQNGSFFTERDLVTANGRYSQYQGQILQDVMMKEADVKDNRAHFF